jgi:hypothetical protein
MQASKWFVTEVSPEQVKYSAPGREAGDRTPDWDHSSGQAPWSGTTCAAARSYMIGRQIKLTD